MTVVRIQIAPWNPWVTIPNGSALNAQGIIIELYKLLKSFKVFDYQLQVGEVQGSLGPDNKWTGVMKSLVTNETDIGGPYFLDEIKTKVIKYAVPLDFSEMVIMTSLVPTGNHPFLIFGTFSFQVWLILLVTTFIVAGTACIVYTVLPSSSKKKKKSKTFSRYLWSFSTSLLGKELGANNRWFMQHVWFTPSFRLIQCVWLMGCIIFIYTFQGTIISAYAANKLKPKHESLLDLLQDRDTEIGTFKKSYPELCLSKLAGTQFDLIWIKAQKNLRFASTDLTWLDRIEEGRLAHVGDSLYARFLIGERFRKTGRCDIRITPLGRCSAYIALATRMGFDDDLFKKFNKKILNFNEARISKRKMMQASLFYEICSHKSSSSIRPLQLHNLFGAFIVLGIGLLCSGICFITEMISHQECIRKIWS